MPSFKAKTQKKCNNTIKKYFDPKVSNETIYREDLKIKIVEQSDAENFLVTAPNSIKKIAGQSDEENSILDEANSREKSTVCNTCEKNVRLAISTQFVVSLPE